MKRTASIPTYRAKLQRNGMLSRISGYICLVLLAATCLGTRSRAQAPDGQMAKPVANSVADTWSHLAALPSDTRIHVAADNLKKTCHLTAVDQEKLTCSSGKHSSGKLYTFSRPEVRSVKLTRYLTSTFAGVGVGLGGGYAIGALVGHVEDPKSSNRFFSGLHGDVITAIGVVSGAGAGGAILGPLDWLRGPTVYRRAGEKR